MFRALIVVLLWLGWTHALGQPVDPAETDARSFKGLLLFWSGAGVLMFLVGRVAFREQMGELRSLRMLTKKIGPFFGEFDLDALNKWVRLAAPHVFKMWRDGDVSAFDGHMTESFAASIGATHQALVDAEQIRETRLGKVLRVHPLGLYMIGEGPPPKDVELLLRVEIRATDRTTGAGGVQVAGAEGQRQIQYFWTLRNDGRQWRLHHIEVATQDRVDLKKKPPLPPIMEWKRPQEAKP